MATVSESLTHSFALRSTRFRGVTIDLWNGRSRNGSDGNPLRSGEPDHVRRIDFYGIIVSLYFFDNRRHHRPHIHVKFQELEAVFGIPEGELLEGSLPRPADRFSRSSLSSREQNLNPRVVAVRPKPSGKIRMTFSNGEARIFDMRPQLDHGVFRELRDAAKFESVKVFLGSVQ